MKLVYSNFNKQTGESVVILQDKNGRYVGKAKLHPSDTEFSSEFAGCRIAEQRAWLDFYKKELKKAKLQLKPLKDLYNYIWYFNSPAEYHTYHTEWIEHQLSVRIDNYTKYIEELKDSIKNLEKAIKDSITARDRIIQKCKRGESD